MKAGLIANSRQLLDSPIHTFLSVHGLDDWLRGQGHFSVFDFDPATTVWEFLSGTCEDMLAFPGDLVLSVLIAIKVWPNSPEWSVARTLVESENAPDWYPLAPFLLRSDVFKDACRSAVLFAENVAAFRRIMAGLRDA